jgi:predicted peptidase
MFVINKLTDMKKVFIILFALTTYFQLSAQGPAEDLSLFEKATYINKDGTKLPYRILYPKNYVRSKKYPLVLFLHGAGERGNDNEKQLTHGAKMFLKAENREKFPTIVIFPQCPEESFWSSVKWEREKKPAFSFDYSRPSNVPLVSSYELVNKMIREEGVDVSRVYITGLSMGGMGTFEAVYKYPSLFAAAMPICGGGDVASYDSRILKTPFWVFHGDADPVVDVLYSRTMVDKLKELKADVKYTEYPGVSHNSWDNAFAEGEFLSWMFAHRR